MFEHSFQFSDVFEPEKDVKTSDLVASIKKTGVLAKRVLDNEDFKSYRSQFEQAQSKLVDAMISYTHDYFLDPKGGIDVYAANMARFITKIQDMRVLLGQVETDLKRAEKVG